MKMFTAVVSQQLPDVAVIFNCVCSVDGILGTLYCFYFRRYDPINIIFYWGNSVHQVEVHKIR